MKAEEIRKVHCFFEQSGTFKKQFEKIGIPAEDYDIQNDFGETNHVIDLFNEIEKEYAILERERERERTVFDDVKEDDIILAFFPCIYFCEKSQLAFTYEYHNYRKKTNGEKIKLILKRAKERQRFYEILLKLVGICEIKKLKLVIENPYSVFSYLEKNFVKKPSIIDKDRMRRGDYYVKPTQYWFFNFEPTHGFTYQNDKEQKIIANASRGKCAGICSEERSMISDDYARNWIYDFILGKYQPDIMGETLFDIDEIE